jgi:tRNA 2-thiouridine synthesizing protein A
MKKRDENEIPDEILDLKGVPCPQNTAKAMVKLSGMDPGEILEIIVDDGEPRENVPASLEVEENLDILNIFLPGDNTCHIQVKVLY